MPTDYKVQPRSQKSLADWACAARSIARKTGRYTIDVVDLIEHQLVKQLSDEHGLSIALSESNKYEDPAFVKFRKGYPRVMLTVQQGVWSAAKKGESYEYFILAHEVAHILLHDHNAVAFANDPSLQIQYAFREDSAEWQADTFAKYLTMPDEALRETRDPTLLSILCNVEERTAQERINTYLRTGPMRVLSYDGNPCPKCSSFTLLHDGATTRCETCHSVVNELELVK